MRFTACGIETDLTDTEIAAIIRQLAGTSGYAENIQAIATSARCALSDRHGEPCADYVADVGDDNGGTVSAWLRWSGDDRRIDWLVVCASPACDLFRGHGGDCKQAECEDRT
jgi:hypothetical protein